MKELEHGVKIDDDGNYIVPENTMNEILDYVDKLRDMIVDIHGKAQKENPSFWPKIELPHISIEKHYCCAIGTEIPYKLGEPYVAKRGFREIFKFRAEDKCRQWHAEEYPRDPYELLDKNCDDVLTRL
ncbi:MULTISPECIES: hypothetical protein [Bacillus cereus group]|uniref:hypothetical protein n=1 Tax=Bacillus cereus group TaxID=86661 RepID=UPI000BF8E7AC|nr:hypothetical protein [Bacillus cereus]MDA2213389.1 hypothetical protein [Bacillus cereus]MDA2224427.1 hypothetical protein [Bacillus cereus]MDA2285860.1 hypothetical protein [Bacillus cereus]MDA2297077.1 hypothetical protein [Bacillus cereus]PFR74299.1 hypothetical protein COK42_30830 [Bacillus cereus]